MAVVNEDKLSNPVEHQVDFSVENNRWPAKKFSALRTTTEPLNSLVMTHIKMTIVVFTVLRYRQIRGWATLLDNVSPLFKCSLRKRFSQQLVDGNVIHAVQCASEFCVMIA